MVRRGPATAVGLALVSGGLVLLGIGSPRLSDRPATVFHVRPGAQGDGSASAPLGSLAAAVERAHPGDEIRLAGGRYGEPLATVRGGRSTQPIVIGAETPEDRPVLEVHGRVATVAHPDLVIDGLIFDGGYGDADAMRLTSGAARLVLRNVEVRRAGRDCIDIGAPPDVRIERALIHHCLNATNGRKDAHGIVAGAVQRLTVKDSEIHTFSGDGVQMDPDRAAPGWTDVRLEGLRVWLQPLPEPANGFARGVVPGENAVDTKTPTSGRRSRLELRDVTAWGFERGLINNMAAFNLKERVDATIDGVTVHHSDIAFRLRGRGDRGAQVTVQNAVLHDVRTGVRYEDDLARLTLTHMTFGLAIATPVLAVNASSTRPMLSNLLVLAESLPPSMRDGALAVDERTFVDAAGGDYRLARSETTRRGTPQPGVHVDRSGRARPRGSGHAVGAHEPE